jgi:hypothetical protein
MALTPIKSFSYDVFKSNNVSAQKNHVPNPKLHIIPP